jgi:type IV pilus assembly protein PilA
MWAKEKEYGFTIVELLIVIVVIGILAAITIVSFNGVQNKANDAAVKSDLANTAKIFRLYAAEHSDLYPVGTGLTNDVSIKVSKNSYGNGFISGSSTYNFLYCRVTDGGSPTDFALVASSKSGTTFYNSSTKGAGELTSGWGSGSQSVCNSLNIPQSNINDRDFLFQDAWKSYVKG